MRPPKVIQTGNISSIWLNPRHCDIGLFKLLVTDAYSENLARHMAIILTNCVIAGDLGADVSVAIPRSHDNLTLLSPDLSYRQTIAALDRLSAMGLVVNIRPGIRGGLVSRWVAGPTLEHFIRCKLLNGNGWVELPTTRISGQIKRSRGSTVKRPPPLTRSVREAGLNLRRINNGIKRNRYALEMPPSYTILVDNNSNDITNLPSYYRYYWDYSLDFSLALSLPSPIQHLTKTTNSNDNIYLANINYDEFLYDRLYDDTISRPTRFISPFQSWSTTERNYLRINGEPTVELDYEALHPTILYHDKGLKSPNGDVYTTGLMRGRGSVKKLLLSMINAANEKDAITGFIRDVERKRKSGKDVALPIGIDLTYKSLQILVHLIREKNKEIDDCFYSQKWRNLFLLESAICEAVMLAFLELGKPCLSIHDSFIVQAKDKELLRKVMISCYQKVVGTKEVPGIK